jgi:membrane protein required for beta-lactamase induction
MTKLVLKIALGFALAGYFVAMGLYFAPSAWHPSPALVLSICPASFLPMLSMTDPSFGGMALVIAPLNAVLYAIVGLVIGLIVEGP